MSTWHWAIVIGAGIAGYWIVSWLIDSRRKERVETSDATQPATPPTGAARDERPQEFTSAWDEMKHRK